MKLKDRLVSDSWIMEEDFIRMDLDLYERYHASHSSELRSLKSGGGS